MPKAAKNKLPVTKRDIKEGLTKLGLKKGDIVGVHSSLSAREAG